MTTKLNQDKSKLVTAFVKKHAVACGGDWTSMLLSAIRYGLPDIYKSMPDKEYSFIEVWNIISDNV